MFGGSHKPYTAVTVQIDRLTSEQYEEEDVGGIIDLIEVIRIQESGPTEAARAIRKKLKYGNTHRQLRGLVILDGLIQNAGARFQRTFADEPLLERLRLMARDEALDPAVRQKCKVLFAQWASSYQTTPGMERIASLYKEFPKAKRPAAAQQKVLQDTEPAAPAEPEIISPPSSRATASHPVTLTPTASDYLSRKDKKTGRRKQFDLNKEKENMTNSIAQASIASTNLLNGLQLINRETERISENPEVLRRFEACKNLRRNILYYIQNVESDEWIGSLVNANDELVKALTAYEIMDRSISDDSDSDTGEQIHASHSQPSRDITHDTQAQLAGLSIAAAPPAKPPRPAAPTSIAMPPKIAHPSAANDSNGDDDEDDNPFGDANAVPTPYSERDEPTWREV